MEPGQKVTLGDITVQTVPAYNLDKEFHPRANNWLGFILTVDGVSIYHAGDTDYIPEMEHLHVDVALLPVSGTYVMTADEAVAAAQAIGPKLAIPMHYGAIVGDDNDAQRFAKALEGTGAGAHPTQGSLGLARRRALAQFARGRARPWDALCLGLNASDHGSALSPAIPAGGARFVCAK